MAITGCGFGSGLGLGSGSGFGFGFGFGFVLERAGFGNARKLAGQFYLEDMTVFKVMFGAIVTAMLGLVVASGLGIVDLATISSHIKRIRRKFVAVDPTFDAIEAVYGAGYRWIPEREGGSKGG